MLFSKLRMIVLTISGSFWLAPSVMAALLGALAVGMLKLDAALGAPDYLGLTPQLGVDGLRTVLSTIAGGMMTVASIVFSLTFVALTSMSSQLGPRILLFFMHDRPTQLVLGAFIGTFLYALIVLVSVGDAEASVPRAALAVAVLLSVAAFGLMIYFVHHIAASIQADVLVARLGGHLVQAIDTLSQNEGGEPCHAPPAPFDAPGEGRELRAQATGYVQLIESAALVEVARRREISIELLFRPADYLVEGAPCVRVYGVTDARGEDEEALEDAVMRTITLGPQRTPAQQAHFEVTALTEVALRALSPGVNDPFTAISCIDRLVEGLARASRRHLAASVVFSLEDEDRPALLERRRDFADYMDAAFAPIRAAARDDVLVTTRIVWGYETLARLVDDASERETLREGLEGLRADVESHFSAARDRDKLLERIDRACETL